MGKHRASEPSDKENREAIKSSVRMRDALAGGRAGRAKANAQDAIDKSGKKSK